MLRSVLQQSPFPFNCTKHNCNGAPLHALRQDPITPTWERLTLNGAPVHAEVSAWEGPHHAKLTTANLQWGPVTGPYHSHFNTTDSLWGPIAH